MKFMEISGKIVLIALAAVCLLAVPALSMPMDNCPSQQGPCAMFAPMNNLTAEEMGNMTLGELKEMHRAARNNTTACRANEPGQNCCQMGMNTNKSPGMKEKGMGPMGKDQMGMGQMGMGDSQKRACPMMDERSGPMNGMHGQDSNMAPKDMKGASPILLLIDDLTVEDLGNMTINQIKDLSQKKMQEMDNMTLNQIKQLQEKKDQERDNMTLNQLKEENRNMWQMAKIFGQAGFGRHDKA
jgi:hypothetical protein